MMNLFKAYEDIERGEYKDVTREDCALLVQNFPEWIGVLIHKLVREKQHQCSECGEKVPSRNHLAPAESRDDVLLCKDCYLDWYYGL